MSVAACPREDLNVVVEWFLRAAVYVLIEAEILVSPVGLRMRLGERRDFRLVHPHRIRLFVDDGGKPV